MRTKTATVWSPYQSWLTGLDPYKVYREISDPKLESYRREYLKRGKSTKLPSIVDFGGASIGAALGATAHPYLAIPGGVAGMLAGTLVSTPHQFELARKADRYAAKKMHPVDVAARLARAHRTMQEIAFDKFLDVEGRKPTDPPLGLLARANIEDFLHSGKLDFYKPKGLASRVLKRHYTSAFGDPRIPLLWSRIEAVGREAKKKGIPERSLQEPVEEEWEKLKKLREQAKEVLSS